MHKIELPRTIIVGEGVLDATGAICDELGLSESCVIVADAMTYMIAGAKVEEILAKKGTKVEKFIVDSATMEKVNELGKLISEKKVRFACGVGGGTAIDVAKLAGSFSRINFISIPTATSHDGIASSRASIKAMNVKTSIEAKTPLAIIADTKVIRAEPKRLFSSGCGDMISKFTAVLDWQLAHKIKGEYYGGYAAQLALMSANTIMESAELMARKYDEGISILLEALISSGVAMSIAGSTRPASGSEHLFSHALDMIAEKPAMHGEQCGVGTIMMAHLHGKDWKKIKTTLQILGAPTTAEELGVKKEDIVNALTMAHTIRPDRYTILGDGLSRDAAEGLARETGVI